MQYRKLPKGTEQVSILGIGTSSIQASSEKEIEKIITAAIENGINNFYGFIVVKAFCSLWTCHKGNAGQGIFSDSFWSKL